MEFSVDPRFEAFVLAYIPLVSIVSIICSLVAFYLLLTKTPRSSDRYKWYLINLQIWSTLLDAHFGISFVPVPLFPLIAGYCRGMLCVLSFPMHYSLSLLFFFGSEVAFAVMLALLFRHQSVIASTSRFKLKTRWKVAFLIVLQLLFIVPSISFFSSARQARYSKERFLKLHPTMAWVTENPQFVFYDSGRMPIAFTVNSSGVGILLCFAFCIAVISHILWNFHLNESDECEDSLNTQQTYIGCHSPGCHYLNGSNIPILFHALSVITMAFPYEVCWVAYCIQLMFTIAHTTILISMTPSYVATILSWFNIHERRSRSRKLPRDFHIANIKYGDRAITVY